METAVLQASDTFGMHPSRSTDGYSYSENPGTPSASPAIYQPAFATASCSRPTYVRRRSAQQTPSGLGSIARGDSTTPRSAAFPQPIFDPDSPFSQPPGRTTSSPVKRMHPSVLRSPGVDGCGGTLEKPWGEDALGSPWATRVAGKIRLEDVAEGAAARREGREVYPVVQDDNAPIAGIKRERGRGRNVVLDPAAAAYAHDMQQQQQQQHEAQLQYASAVAGPSKAYGQHHRGQSDDLHNRHHFRSPQPSTPSTYYVPTLQTTAPSPLSPSTFVSHYQPPRVISPLPGGNDWGQFVNTELFEEGNSQEEISPNEPVDGSTITAGSSMSHPELQALPESASTAHSFHHPRPRPMLNADDLEPTPLLEPHSDTSPTFSLPSRSQPGTPASFGVPDYAEHQLHPTSAYSSSSSSSAQYQQFASAQPYNPTTLDSFNPAQMHLPPSSFSFTSTIAHPPPPSKTTTARVPDYRGHRRIKSIESVISEYGPHVIQEQETIPEEYNAEPSYTGDGGKDDYALNTLVKQVHIQHASAEGAQYESSRLDTVTPSSSRAPSPAMMYPQPPPHLTSYPYSAAPPTYSQLASTSAYPQYSLPTATPVILVPHGQPPPPGMVPVATYPETHSAPGYLHPRPPAPVVSPVYHSSYSNDGSPYSTNSPVMDGGGATSEAGSSHAHRSPVLQSSAPPSKEVLTAKRRSNRRGGSLSIPTSRNSHGEPLSMSSSLSAADLASQPSESSSVHYHPYSRPSPIIPSSSASAAPSSSRSTSSRKSRASISGTSVSTIPIPPSTKRREHTRKPVEKAAITNLIESLYEPLGTPDPNGSESASPPALDYDTATGGKGKGKEELKFRCLVEGCDRAFPRRSAIVHHIQMHLSDKPFVCPADGCNASFVRQHDLRRHERIHSETKAFTCPCGKGFTRGDALVRHRQRGICIGSTAPPESP